MLALSSSLLHGWKRNERVSYQCSLEVPLEENWEPSVRCLGYSHGDLDWVTSVLVAPCP